MLFGHLASSPTGLLVRFCRTTLGFSLAVAAVLCSNVRPVQAQPQSPQVLHSHVRSQVANGTAALVSSMPSNQQLPFTIVLPLRNQAALTSLLGRLYNPTSPDYRHFLTVAQFTDQFGPTLDDYQAVRAYAQNNGFTITGDPANRQVVSVTGTVAQINSAFNVRMNLYQHPTEKRTFFSLDREPSLQLSVPVAHIDGLDSYSLPRHMSERPKQSGTNANQSQPLTSSVTGSGPGGAYLASDMRAAYYGGTQLDGTGQAVGLVEFGGYLLSDVNSTFTNAGQTYVVPINNVLLDGSTGAPSGEDGEQVLDIVQAIGMAPNLSQVRVYIGNGNDNANILNSMASENIAKQLSCSWGWIPADPTTDDVFFQEMAAQGQTFFTASGDDGAYYAALSPYFYPADDIYVTAVGGTHLTTNGMAGSWASEVVWNSDRSGSGGGISPDAIAIPTWQVGLATSANGGSNTFRNVPDVAMEGDFDNYLCQLGVCEGDWAGTSFATPRWAGFMALINQQAVEAGNAPMGGLGFLNTNLYQLAQGANAASDLHDITSGNNDTDNQPTWFSAVPGYDLTTGWGSAFGQSLINDLAGQQVPGFWIASSQTTVGVNPGSTATAVITITDAGGFTGSVDLAATNLPAGVTASFSPSSTTGTSVLTLTASSSLTTETGTITITGTSGSLTSSANITVSVHAPIFLLSAAPATVGVNQGASSTSTITVTPQYGFSGAVTLAASGLPSGVTATFTTNPTSGTSIVTFAAGSTAAAGTSTVTITGTSGSLTATTSVALTVQGPSFTLSAGGTTNIGQGSSGYAYIYVEDLYGFNGSVSLALSGLPTGVTASFSPNPTTGSSTLTFTAGSSAPVGQSTITITGTSGALTATTTVTLAIYAPAFTLSSYNAINIGLGNSGSGYVYVDDEYGFNGNVTLSVAGLPTGVTAVWSPNPTTYSSNLTLSASTSAKTGQYPLTITGTSGSLTATTNVTVGVYTPTFTVTAYNATLGQGTTTSTSAYISPQYGFTGSVNLSVSGLPSGVTATFTPNPTTGSSTLTLQASSTAALGQYTATLTGTSGTQTVTSTFTVGVYTPTFTLYSGGNINLGQGAAATTTYVDINPEYGFTGSVNLAVTGLPSGVTASFSPNPTTGYSTLTLQASSTAALGQYNLTITGTSGTQTATTTLTLGIYTPSFTLSGSGSVTVGQGASTTSYVNVYPQYGFTGSVNFSVTGLPTGVTASFSPNPTNGTATLTLAAASTAALGQYTLTITGTSGTQTATTNLTLGVFAPTFTIATYSTVSLGQGSSAAAYIYVTPQYGFAGGVNLAVSGLPSGVTASFSPNPATGTSVLTLTASSAAAIGSSTLTITGTYGSQTASTTLPLSIYAPSFTLYSSLYNVSLNEGASTSGYIYSTAQYGFSGAITYSATGLPSGVTATFSPNPTTGTATVTLSASSAATPGTVTLTLTGTSGSTTASTSVTLTVNAPSFTLTDAPGEISLLPGGTDRSTLSIVPQYGFAGSVSYAATGLPNGVTVSFSPNPTTGTSTATFTAGSAAAPGTSTVTITGTSGSTTTTTTLQLTVISAKNTTATTLTLSAAGSPVTSINGGTAVTATASVSTGSSTPINTGEIIFCDASASTCDSIHRIGSAQLTNAGTATLSFIPGPGTRSYAATFIGTNANASSTSAPSNLTITAKQPSTTTMTTAGAAGNYTLSAKVTGTGPSAPSGSVSFLDTTNGNAPLGQATLGNGTSVYSASLVQSAATGAYPEGIVRGDFNEDGIQDIAVGNTDGGITILLGNGDGTFRAGPATLAPGTDVRSLVVGDLNRDGHSDLAVLSTQSNAVMIFLGNGDGTFTQTGSNPPTGSYPLSLVIGDFNGDGLQDIAVANEDGASVSILTGNGDGTFLVGSSVQLPGLEPFALAVGDFNGDGVKDLAVVNNDSLTTTILLGNGDGTFNPLSFTATNNAYPDSVAVADFNQDGKPDLVLAGTYGTTMILLGNGDGTFTAAANVASGFYNNSVAVADFNQDGFPDVAEPNEYSNTVEIFLGKGDGTFNTGITYTAGSDPFGIIAGDWNGDGIPDLAVTNYYSSTLSVFTSQLTQTATATASNISPVGAGQHAVEASFPGNSGFSASASATALLTGASAAPTVTLTPSSASVSTTQPVTITIAVGDGTGNPIPTGAIILSGGGYTSSSTPLSTGSASITIPAGALTAGADTLTASYTPDANSSSTYTAATGTTSVTVGKAMPTVTVTPALSSITTLQSVAVSIAISGGTTTPTGSVTLTSGNYTSAAVALSGGNAGITIPAGSLPAGSDLLTVTYIPDTSSSAIYTGAAGTSSITVGKTTPAVTLGLSSGTITTTQSLTVNIAVNPGSGTAIPTGAVTLTSGSFTSTPATLTGGSASIVIPAGTLPAGADSLSVTYIPDSTSSPTFNSASGSGSVSVGKVTPSVSATTPPGAITIASPFNVTIAVNGGAGNPTPTGTVILTSGSYTSASTPLTAGSATIVVPAGSLAAGADPLNISYTPDSTSALIYSSNTGLSSITISKVTPAVALSLSSPTISTTQSLIVTLSTNGGNGAPVATGTVTLVSGKYTSSAYPLTGGTAAITIPPDTLPAGLDTLTATYTPDAASSPTYITNTGSASVTVATAAPQVNLNLSSSAITTLQSVTVNTVLNPGSGNPAPTGTLTLTGGGYTSAPLTLNNGSAAVTIPAGSLTAGTDSLTATYTPDTAGSAIYTSSTGAATVTVSKATPTVIVTPSPATITTIQAATVTISVSGGSGAVASTGTVTLTSGSYTSAATTLSAGAAVIPIPAGTLPAGTGTLTVSYTPDTTGSAIYTPATGAAPITVGKAAPTLGISLSAPAITTLQPLVVTVSATAASTPTGAITLISGSYTSAPIPLSNGTAAITIAAGSLSAGSDTLTVSYTPDTASSSTYSSASNAATVTVTRVTPTVTVTPASASITDVQSLNVTISVSASASTTGTVTLTSASYTSAATPLTNGTATITIPASFLPAGSDALSATYLPDASGSALFNSALGSGSVTVGKAVPSVNVSLSASTITTTQPLTVTIAASAGTGSATPTGTITITSGSYTSAATTLANGSAAITIPASTLAAGTDTLTATYAPDTTSAAVYSSGTGTGSVTVSKATPSVTLTPSLSTITTNQAITVTVAISGGTGTTAATGTVSLSGAVSAMQQTLQNGSATFTLAAGSLAAGTDTLQAAYTPDAASIYTTASQSTTVTVTTAATATITVSPAASPITYQQSETVSVTVTGAAGTPTGTVTLSSGTYSAVQPLSGGVASFTIAAGALSGGSDTLSAVYSGSNAYAPGNGSATVTVYPVTMTLPSIATINPGSTGSGNLTFNGSSAYAGSLNLTCSLASSPSGAQSLPTCSINPASVTLTAGGTATAAFTVATTAQTAALDFPAGWKLRSLPLGGSAVAAALVFLFPRRRRRIAGLLMVLLLIALGGATGCSSGGGNGQVSQPVTPATTAGNYTFNLTAADSAGKFTTSSTITVTVQ